MSDSPPQQNKSAAPPPPTVKQPVDPPAAAAADAAVLQGLSPASQAVLSGIAGVAGVVTIRHQEAKIADLEREIVAKSGEAKAIEEQSFKNDGDMLGRSVALRDGVTPPVHPEWLSSWRARNRPPTANGNGGGPE